MTFGTPFSNERLPLYWWKSPLSHRILRGLISILVYWAIVFLFGILPHFY